MLWQPRQGFISGRGALDAAATAAAFSITYVGSATNTTAGTSFSFNSQAIGTADATRIVVVGIADAVTAAITVTGVTIAGNAATQATSAASDSGGGALSDIWYLAVPTGTTANIVVSVSSSQTRAAIVVYSVTNSAGGFSSASNTASGPAVTTLGATATVPSGGGAIAVLNSHTSAAATTVTNGGNLTIDNNGTAFGNSAIGSGKNTTASGSTTFTFNWTTAADATVSVITFNP